jgi:hypothetical protein
MRNQEFLGAFFVAHNATKNRAFRGCAIAPAPALRAVAASHPSNPLRAQGLPKDSGAQTTPCLRQGDS